MKKLSEIHDLIVLSPDEIETLMCNIGWKRVIEAIRETFYEEEKGRTISPAKTVIPIDRFNNDFRTMPSYMEKYPQFVGCKIVCVCPDNPKKFDLPLVMGTFILHDAETQKPLMMCDCNIPTAWRTAGASAVAVDVLAEKDAKTLGIVGCGQQLYYHIPAIMAVRNIEKILVCDINNDSMSKAVKYFGEKGLQIDASGKQKILDKCDIVVTMTPTKIPHILHKNITIGKKQMICSIGGDSKTKLELHPGAIPIHDHYCDSLEQVLHTGVVYQGLKWSWFDEKDLCSLGSIITGEKKLQEDKNNKLFLSTGVALEDLTMGILMYKNLDVLKLEQQVKWPFHNHPADYLKKTVV